MQVAQQGPQRGQHHHVRRPAPPAPGQLQAAKLDHDLGLTERPHDAEFDEFILHVDGWLCQIKDAQIRDGLHVFGSAPEGADRVNLVLAILRARQMWGGRAQALPGLREALGYAERSDDRRSARLSAAAAWSSGLSSW